MEKDEKANALHNIPRKKFAVNIVQEEKKIIFEIYIIQNNQNNAQTNGKTSGENREEERTEKKASNKQELHGKTIQKRNKKTRDIKLHRQRRCKSIKRNI